MDGLKDEIAAVAARLVVEEGLEYGPAKHRAARQMGLGKRATLPDNPLVDAAVREYIEIFCAEEQALELRALRTLALQWMLRLQQFRPFITGAVWQGTATKHSGIYLQLFCDDPKSAEIALIDAKIKYDVGGMEDFSDNAPYALRVIAHSEALPQPVSIQLLILDQDAIRSMPGQDSQGRSVRGNAAALSQLLESCRL